MIEENTTISAEQNAFNEEWVVTAEICKELDVTRASIVYAHRRGLLPEPIIIPGTKSYIWKREDVTPYVRRWQEKLIEKRGY